MGSAGPPSILLTPDASLALFRGDTLTVQAVIRNSRFPEVRFSSSAPGVATVDPASGLVRAVAVGEATVTAFSSIDPRIFAELAVTIHEDLPAAIELLTVRDGAGNDADPAALRGSVTVLLRLQRGSARRFELALGDSLICAAAYPRPDLQPPPDAEVSCGVDTGTFDPTTGRPRFLNGDQPLNAVLFASDGRLLASLEATTVRLANEGMIVTRTGASRQALDLEGRTWLGGNLTLDALPVVYDPGGSITSVTARYRRPDGADTVAVDREAPFSFLLLSGGVLAGVTDTVFRVEVSSESDDGKPGPEGSTPAQRYDAAPPLPGTILPRDWVGTQTMFASSYSAVGEADAGVGRTRQRYFAGDAALDSVSLVAAGVQVTTGADLAQAAARSYRLAVQVCDALLNCTIRNGYLFGVDLTPPLIESVGLLDRIANPATDLSIGVRDDLSGFPTRFLEASVTLLDASPATPTCGPLVEGIDLPGRAGEGGCAPDTLGSPLPVPRTTPGYYRYNFVAFDRAGNRSAGVNRVLLVDRQPPVLDPFTLPTILVAGEDAVLQAKARDGVDLTSLDFRLVYPEAAGGSIGIPYAPPTAVGAPFDEVLTPEATITGTFPFVRTLTYAGAAAGVRKTVIADSLRVIALDAAEQTAMLAAYIPRSAFANDTTTTDPFPRFSTAVAGVDRTAVCSGGCGAGDPTSVRISVRVEGETGTGRPFARLHLYRRDPAGRLAHIGSVPGGDATITNTGTHSTFVYTLDFAPPLNLTGDFTVVAVGVTSRGNGLVTERTGPAAPLITFYRR